MNVISSLSKVKKIDANILKIIAIAAMIIDHIGYYFEPNVNHILYSICRDIGRIAMPIFVYLLVQGFFHTKNFKKYVTRVFLLAVTTQIGLLIVGAVNKSYFENYYIDVNIRLNILFSFVLSLVLMYLIHTNQIIKKWDINKNMILKIFMILAIIGIYLFIKIDYEILVPLLVVLFYLIERLRISFYINKQNTILNIKSIAAKVIDEKKIRIIYLLLIFIAEVIIIYQSHNTRYWYMLLSLIPIAMYSGEKGKKTKWIDSLFYLIFPIQHLLLYIIAMIIN